MSPFPLERLQQLGRRCGVRRAAAACASAYASFSSVPASICSTSARRPSAQAWRADTTRTKSSPVLPARQRSMRAMHLGGGFHATVPQQASGGPGTAGRNRPATAPAGPRAWSAALVKSMRSIGQIRRAARPLPGSAVPPARSARAACRAGSGHSPSTEDPATHLIESSPTRSIARLVQANGLAPAQLQRSGGAS